MMKNSPTDLTSGFRFGPPPAAASPFQVHPHDGARAMPPAPTVLEIGNALKSATQLSEGVEGTISFKSWPFVSYRYRITTKNDQLRIWLEDMKAKKQWETEDLKLEDFVREDSVIPMAKFDDYAVCFANCLQNPTSSDFSCGLTHVEGSSEAWTLTLQLKVRVFVTEWTPTYTMLLKPIALESTDILAAKIRDQEDQIQSLQTQVKLLTAKLERPVLTAPAFLTGRSMERVGQNETIVWKCDGSAIVGILFRSSGLIQFAVAGTFVVNLTVHNQNTSNNTPTVELKLNGKTVSSCADSDPNGHVHATPLCHVLTASGGDEIKVVYMGTNQAIEGSQIAIYQLR